MHRAQVVLHVRVDVRVRWAERGVAVCYCSWRKADEGDVRYDRAASQTCRSEQEGEKKSVNDFQHVFLLGHKEKLTLLSVFVILKKYVTAQ